MIILFYLSSGLFLGWSLGANDAANIFGTAVGSRMVRFKKAAVIASIFVIIGAVVQGAGASETLGKLGNISTLAAAFTVALSAALSVYWMTRMKLPVSTSQAIVGAIIGWNFYTNNPTDIGTLTKIVTTWISGPLLGGVFAILLFMLVKRVQKKVSLHLLYRDAIIRYGLLLVGGFGAYSLGANNIANVMGVFTGSIDLPVIDLGFATFNSTEQLFFIGGVAIAIGIITYSKRVMETVGNTLMPLTPEAAIVVVLAQSLVLFIFSSQTLSNSFQSIGLPPIPLVPVSSSQVVIGAILGIGLYKGGKEIKFNILGSISLGWLATPIVAGLVSFFLLFFVNNVFKKDVGANENSPVQEIVMKIDSIAESAIKDDTISLVKEKQDITVENTVSEKPSVSTKKPVDVPMIVFGSLSFLLLLLVIWFTIKIRKNKQKQNRLVQNLENKYSLKIENFEISLEDYKVKQNDLDKELKFRQSEMVTMAMNIIQKNEFLSSLKSEIIEIKSSVKDPEARQAFNRLSLMISQNLSIDRDREKFQMHINEQNSNFLRLLSEKYPSITENEKRLTVLLRLNLSSKEIASILNISPKSVEMNRYRLRKKLKVSPKVNLSDFIRDL
jgi:phosphate/sulfate permease/DNA-binding CsgD family transcriptional regulator